MMRLKIGEVLIKDSKINENQLQHALQVQKELIKKKRLGEILVDLGYVSKRDLREVTTKYEHKVQLGVILIENRAITPEVLEEALEIQKEKKKPIGEILIDLGAITEEEFAKAFSIQMDLPYVLPDKRLIDMKLFSRLPEKFMREYGVLPMWENEGAVTVLVHDPTDGFVQKFLRNTYGEKYEMAVAPKSAVKKVLEEIVKEKELVSSSMVSPLDETQQAAFRRYPMDDDTPARGATGQIVNIVNYILSNAIKERASDIHIESQVDRLRVRYRIDGKLIYRTDLPKYLMDPIIRRLKVMARMDITEIRETQEGRIFISYNKQDIDLRISIFTTVLGGTVTIRLLTKELGLRDLEDLGMLPRVLKTLKLILDSPSGLILFTGPTGCGKTTSLYACLNYLNTWNVKIVTLEDPVEYSIEGISQCQVKSMQEGIIAERVKSMMHQDPDVMVIGEISNESTAYGAIQTALTGHMVCSTIHTDDSIGAVLRLMDSGLRTFLLSSTSMAILSQRLVRKICPQCRERYSPSVEIVKEFHIKDFDPDRFEFYRGKGCAECNYTGYFGRSGAFELLAMNDEIRSAFLLNKNAAEIRRLAYKTGNYISLRESGFIKALQHISTLEEGIGVLSYSERESFASIDLTFQEIQRWSGIEIEKEEVSTPERAEVKQPTSTS